MEASGFIETEQQEIPLIDVQPLTQLSGSTCLLYCVRHQGKRLLMKRLRLELITHPRMVEIFHKEYETGIRIQSPYLVEYVSMGEDIEGPYILMEYVDGDTMAEVLATRSEWFADSEHLLRFFDQLLSCLQSLHNHQILHLDLKPDNILLTRVSSDVKVIDLGFCYSDTYYCTTGQNPVYAAPEQKSGSGQLDVRTDLYAVGKLLEHTCQQADIVINRKLQQVIDTATQTDQHLRYASADAMKKALRNALDPSRRLWWVMAVAVLLSVGAFIIAVFEHQDKPRIVNLDEYQYMLLSDDSLTCCVDRYICDWPIPNPQNRCIYSPLRVGDKDYKVTHVGDSLFTRDSIVQTVAIPEGVTHLGATFCMECRHLQSVSLPTTLQHIGYDAFAGCEQLSSISLPEGVRFIGHNAFVGTSRLRHVTIPPAIRILHQDCFTASGIRSVTLPDSLEVLERGVFYGCNRLRRIVLPATLRRIGDFCFHDCDSLLEVVALNPDPISITDVFAMSDTTLQRTLYVPAASVEKYKQAPYWNQFAYIQPIITID